MRRPGRFPVKITRLIKMHSGASQMPAILCPAIDFSLSSATLGRCWKINFSQFYSTSSEDGKNFYTIKIIHGSDF